MNQTFVILMLVLAFASPVVAQECGPSCPVCSGSGNGASALLSQNSVMISGLSIPTADEERTVVKVGYGMLGWLDAGVGYAIRTEKVLWSVRAQPLLEQKNGWRPGFIMGTGSVQTGGSDQSVYAQLIKTWGVSELLDLRFSTGTATLVPDFDEVYGLAGIAAILQDRYSASLDYDGKSMHTGLSWFASDWLSLSFLMVEMEYPAFSIVFRQ